VSGTSCLDYNRTRQFGHVRSMTCESPDSNYNSHVFPSLVCLVTSYSYWQKQKSDIYVTRFDRSQ